MFDVAPSELLLIVIVAIVVIGPKDLPMALRTAGRWIGKFRRMSNHFRSGIESMIREAELEEMEKKWREQNEAILRAHPHPTQNPADGPLLPAGVMIEGDAVTRAGPEASGSAPEPEPADTSAAAVGAGPHLPPPPP